MSRTRWPGAISGVLLGVARGQHRRGGQESNHKASGRALTAIHRTYSDVESRARGRVTGDAIRLDITLLPRMMILKVYLGPRNPHLGNGAIRPERRRLIVQMVDDELEDLRWERATSWSLLKLQATQRSLPRFFQEPLRARTVSFPSSNSDSFTILLVLYTFMLLCLLCT